VIRLNEQLGQVTTDRVIADIYSPREGILVWRAARAPISIGQPLCAVLIGHGSDSAATPCDDGKVDPPSTPEQGLFRSPLTHAFYFVTAFFFGVSAANFYGSPVAAMIAGAGVLGGSAALEALRSRRKRRQLTQRESSLPSSSMAAKKDSNSD
jgi:hypothetical protein